MEPKNNAHQSILDQQESSTKNYWKYVNGDYLLNPNWVAEQYVGEAEFHKLYMNEG